MHLFHKVVSVDEQFLESGDVIAWGDYEVLHTTGFDQNSEKFECPVSAVYEFAVHIRGRPFEGELVLDSGLDIQVLLKLAGRAPSSRTNISGSVIVRCETGSTVFARATGNYNLVVEESSFTGKILHEL